MAEIWIAITGVIILFLFWRQLVVFKLAQKVNYAPLVLSIGAISAISLFVFSSGELKHDIQYSLMPLLISLIFFMIMQLMYQTKQNRTQAQKESHEQLLSTLIADISGYFGVLDEKLGAIESIDEKTLDAMQLTLKNEFSEFSQLSTQQKLISAKLEEMYVQEESALLHIQKFLEKDMHDLDSVVHRHIDILRIAEQDHFNKILDILNNMNLNSELSTDDEAIQSLKSDMQNMKIEFKDSAQVVINETKSQLNSVTKQMLHDLQSTKQLSESLSISTQEYEVKIQELHKQASLLLEKSDIIHESMEDTYTQSQKIRPVYSSLNELISRLMDIYAEYKHAKKELHILAGELGNAEDKHFEIMDKKIDDLGEDIRAKIEASLHELKEHYHIADRDVTNTVKELAAKAQIQKSYADD